jgi:hydrogenase maturation factor HypE
MGNYEIWKKISRINELKSYLRESDYQAIKFAEGEMTAEEYAETKAKRKAWRKEINELEEQLKEINYGS